MISQKINNIFETHLELTKHNQNKPKEDDKIKEEEAYKLIKKILSMNLSEFKESIHKEYLQFQHRINDSIHNLSQNVKNVAACEKRLIEQFADIKIKTDKIELISDKLSQIDDKITIYEIRSNNLNRDFRAAVDKYDSLFLDNLNVPGKIGKFCKYKNIREFLSYALNKFNEFDLKKESDNAKMKYGQEKIQKYMKKINCEIDVIREEIIQISNKKASFLEKKINEEISEVNKKIESIPVNIANSEIEEKLNNLFENLKTIKESKNELDNKISIIENDIEILRDNINHKYRNNNEKKNSKVSFPNISNLKIRNSYINKDEESEQKENNSPNNISKSYTLNTNKSNFYNFNNNNNGKNNNNDKIKNDYDINNNFNNNDNAYIKSENNLNLDNINEELNENKESTPIHNMMIKSVNFFSQRIKNNNLNKSNKSDRSNKRLEVEKEQKIDKNNLGLNNSYKTVISINQGNFDDSSEDEEKKQKLEDIIVNKISKEQKIEKNNIKKINKGLSLGEQEGLSISTTKLEKIQNLKNTKNNIIYNFNLETNKINKNSNSFPKYRSDEISPRKNKFREALYNKSKKKKENIKSNKKEKSLKNINIIKNEETHTIDNKSNEKLIKIEKNIITDINKENIVKNEIINNNKVINEIIEKDNLFIIKNNININVNKNINKKSIILRNKKSNIKAADSTIKNIHKQEPKENLKSIEIFNNNSIKDYNEKPSNEIDIKTTKFKNNSFDYPKIKKTHSSPGMNIVPDNSDIKNVKFSNHEVNKKNREIPKKIDYYNLLKYDSKKKENLIKNRLKPLNPKEIKWITNSSFKSHSYSKKKLKKGKLFHYSIYKYNEKNKERNINLELKIIPANFKESKKIQVNLSEEE